ncbi:MAG: hypothetical protein IPM29_03050 [Planctomycetes bacterium]|nr:hypothetical protein [Planctomycetota bacterium]
MNSPIRLLASNLAFACTLTSLATAQADLFVLIESPAGSGVRSTLQYDFTGSVLTTGPAVGQLPTSVTDNMTALGVANTGFLTGNRGHLVVGTTSTDQSGRAE